MIEVAQAQFPYRNRKFKIGDRVLINEERWNRAGEVARQRGYQDDELFFLIDSLRGVHFVSNIRPSRDGGVFSPQELSTAKGDAWSNRTPQIRDRWISGWYFDLAEPPEEGEL